MDNKKNIVSFFAKRKVIKQIIHAISNRSEFLIIGHINPDDDCIGSMVAIALLIRKFHKKVSLYLSGKVHDHFQYLLDMCEYNNILIMDKNNISTEHINNIDTVILCDTAKLSMIDSHEMIDDHLKSNNILKIEIDHHTGADSEYFGDPGYQFVMDASSASELVGQIVLVLRKNKTILKAHHIGNPLSRNIILAILTGIVGDTNMGKYLKSKRELKYYNIFSNLYNKLLHKETIKKSNLSNITEVHNEISKLTTAEKRCYDYMIKHKKFTKAFGYIILSQDDIEYLSSLAENEVIVNVSRSIADALAEESGKLSLVAFYDNPEVSNLIQFRIRRSQSFKEFDVRRVLNYFSISNGGGHEGAIGFRIPKKTVNDLNTYAANLMNGIEKIII